MTVTKTKITAKNSSTNFMSNSQNELPLITSNNELLVDARLLHEKLKSRRQFGNWISDRIKDYDFQEGKDFITNLLKSTGGRKAKEYHLTLDMAKELAMLERNEVGKQIRRYFIEAEKELRTKRLYAASSSVTEIGKRVKPININGRKLYDYRQCQVLLGFSPRSSISNVRRAGYAGLIVVFDGKSYCSEEYLKVMMSSAKTRALRAEAKAAKPVLPENFGQFPLQLKGGSHA
jgi:phage anti-repressor protein